MAIPKNMTTNTATTTYIFPELRSPVAISTPVSDWAKLHINPLITNSKERITFFISFYNKCCQFS